jgi:hypothetical protein
MQSWLQASAEDASSNEDELVMISSTRHQECLVEPGFDTSDAAIFSDEYSESDREALKPIVWRRVTGMLIVPTLHYSRLVQVGHRLTSMGALAWCTTPPCISAVTSSQVLRAFNCLADAQADMYPLKSSSLCAAAACAGMPVSQRVVPRYVQATTLPVSMDIYMLRLSFQTQVFLL